MGSPGLTHPSHDRRNTTLTLTLTLTLMGLGFSPGLDPILDVQVSTSITVHTECTNALLPLQPPQPLQYPLSPLRSPYDLTASYWSIDYSFLTLTITPTLTITLTLTSHHHSCRCRPPDNGPGEGSAHPTRQVHVCSRGYGYACMGGGIYGEGSAHPTRQVKG